MKISRKKLCIAISIIFLITISLIAQVPKASASESAPDQVTTFLRDVVMLDMSKYTVTVILNNVEHPPELDRLDRTAITLLLESSQSQLYANAFLVNGALSSCAVRAENGEPEYTQQLADNFADAARSFLTRYEIFSKDSTVETMRNMLNASSEIKPGDTMLGNIKMSVSDLINPTFTWTTTYNGVDYNSLQVSFQSYQPFFSFMDNRHYLTIGNTDVSVSMDQAINTAKKRLENFSWIIIENDGTQTKVPSFNVSTIDATLSVQGRENPLVLYPLWNVNFVLDKTYPGNVRNVIVKVWADTGEVNSTYPLTMSNWVANEPANVDGNGTSTSTPSPNPSSLNPILIALPVTIIVIAVLLVTIRKRGK